jgi:CubicO group peptidase (beta-lactamase class C family)
MSTRVLVVAAALCAALAAAADLTTLQTVFNNQVKGSQLVYAAASVTQDTTRVLGEYSGAFGYKKLTSPTEPMWTDSSLRMESLGETLVGMAVLKLIQDSLLVGLDTEIPAKYFPRQVQLVNPLGAGSKKMTLRQLMTHTSTLKDDQWSSYFTTAPTSVLSLSAFLEAYFLDVTGAAYVQKSSIFTAVTPGDSASYKYAKINIALLTHIVEVEIASSSATSLLVSSTTEKTAIAYIQEHILAPLGMTNTFFTSLTGTFATLSSPAATPFFTGARMTDVNSGGTAVTSTKLHPGILANYMTYTSASDISKMIRALFVDTQSTFFAHGTTMKAVASKFTVSATAATSTGMTGQGTAVQYFDGATLCAKALANGAVTSCIMTASTVVWGMVANGDFSQVSYMCTEQTTARTVCTTAVYGFRESLSGMTADLSLAMAGTALQLAIGDTSTTTQVSSTTDEKDPLFGMWVGGGVILVLAFVFAAAYLTEFVIQPAPVMGGVPVPAGMMPEMRPTADEDPYFNPQATNFN